MWYQVQATEAVPGQGCPLIRTKHAMCFTADGHIYLYGGRSMANKALCDLWRFDTAQDQWEEVISRNDNKKCSTYNYLNNHNKSTSSSTDVRPHGSGTCSTSSHSSSSSHSSAESSPLSYENRFEPPPPLQEHTIVAAKNKLYLFGGQVGYSSDETPLWIFDLICVRWSKFSGKSSACTSQPLGRRGHTAVLYKNIMSIYGGYQDLKGSTSELWTFYLDRGEWTKEGGSFRKCPIPPARHAHSAVVYKESMFVYGGMTDLQVRGDFWSWNYKNKKWLRIKTLKNPGELCCHSAIVVNDSMFIYGGERANGNTISELWQYRFDSQTWQHVNVEGVIPGCRTRHVAVAIPFFNLFNAELHFDLIASSNCLESNIKETSFIDISKSDSKSSAEQLEIQPKKSLSLCFDTLENGHREFMSPEVEAAPKKKIIKSNSFRVGRRRSPKQLSYREVSVHKKEFSPKKRTEAQTATEVRDQENDQNESNTPNECVLDYTSVRMRPRRPLLQRQRPYSDFCGNASFIEDFDFSELNEKQLKRRSVQESMSYYSLCFPTPPASLKLNHSSWLAPVIMSPVMEPDEVGKSKAPELASPTGNQATASCDVVRRRDSSNIKRRIRKANLELSELGKLNTYLLPSCSSQSANFYNTYSLGLDASPDFEKELKCSSGLSTPSDELNNHSMDNYEYENEEMVHGDLDLIEDYLEPEEMLEIVTETIENCSPTFHMKTINKTPARSKRNTRDHPQLLNSVSHSSSGYQSLILADGPTNGSFEIFSNPSLSSSPSLAEQPSQQPAFPEKHNSKHESQNHNLSRSITLNMSNHQRVQKIDTIELKNLKSLEESVSRLDKVKEFQPRARSCDRMQEITKLRSGKSHWQPNFKEAIPEVIVPRSPAIDKFEHCNRPEKEVSEYVSEKHEEQLKIELFGVKKKHLVSLGRRQKNHNGIKQNWQLCMYIFGGREGTASALMNKQPITIWKLYI